MANVHTNKVAQIICEESAVGTAGTAWDQLGPNAISDPGAENKSVARAPISPNNQREAGAVVDLDVKLQIDADAILDHLETFMEGAIRRSFTGATKFRPTAVTSTGYTVASGGAIANGLLVYARGFSTAANNGIKVLAGTSTGTEVKTTGLTAEASPPANAILEVCGVQATTADVTVVSGNLVSTVLDWTTLPIAVGQDIHVGDSGTAYQFATLADHGFARVTAISATTLTLDRKGASFVNDAGTGKTIRILFGRKTNVCPSTDASYIDKTYQTELYYPTLGSGGAARYEYTKGLAIDEMTIVIPSTDKATMTVSMVGTGVETITASRKSGASTARAQNKKVAINTSADVGRISVMEVDETGLTTYIKSATIRIKNTATPNKAIGVIGSVETTKGNCEVSFDWSGYFTNEDVVSAAAANDAIGAKITLRNADGAIVFDIPEARLGAVKRDFVVNELVQCSSTVDANRDPIYNTSLTVSLFPYCPAVRTA